MYDLLEDEQACFLMCKRMHVEDDEERESLILKVGADSGEALGRLCKYGKSDTSSAADRWIYSDRLSDLCTHPLYEGEGEAVAAVM